MLCRKISYFVNVAKGTCASVLGLVQFDNFALTTGVTHSYSSHPFLCALDVHDSRVYLCTISLYQVIRVW